MAESRETSRITAVVTRTALSVLMVLCLASGQWAAATTASAQTQCDDSDECTVQDSCQQDGTCTGTPKPDRTECRVGDQCATFECLGGTCTPNTFKEDGTECDDGLAFTQNDVCFSGFCFGVPDIGDCPDDGNECTFEYFNPVTQKCEKFDETCEFENPCFTWQCNQATGDCQQTGAKPENTSCNDDNVCTSNDRCQAGTCAGSAVVVPTGLPTEDETESPTPTRSQTPTPSRTATASATVTSSTTPETPATCGTDCSGDGKVAVDDVVRLVNNECSALPNRTQADLILAVSGALGTCAEELPTPTTTATQSATPSATASTTPSTSPGAATPTTSPSPSATSSATGTATATTTATASHTITASPTTTRTATASPTITDTPSTPVIPNVPERAAGTIQTSNDVFLSISRIFGLVVGIAGGAGSGASVASPEAPSAACQEGSLEATVANLLDCLFSGAAPVFAVTMTDCKVTGPSATLTGNGSLTITGSPGDKCTKIPKQSTLDAPSVTLEASASTGSTTLTLTNLTGQLNLLDPVDPCNYETFFLQQLQGTVGIVTRDNAETEYSSTAKFTNSDLEIKVTQYNVACVPVVFTTTVNGGVEITAGNLTPFTGQFKPYVIRDDATSGTDMTTVSGVMESVCLGGSAEFATDIPMVTTIGEPCPRGGAVLVTLKGNTDRITYTATGGVEIDVGNNGGDPDQSFGSCLEVSPCS